MPAGRRSAQQTPCQVSTQRMTPSALAIKLHFSQHLRRIVCIQCSQLPLLCCQRSARLVLQSVWLKCPCVRAHSMAYSIVSVLVCVVRLRQDTLYAITILLRWGACVVPAMRHTVHYPVLPAGLSSYTFGRGTAVDRLLKVLSTARYRAPQATEGKGTEGHQVLKVSVRTVHMLS